MQEKEQMESLYRQMYNGMIQKDGGLLEEILDDSFVLVHMTGMRQSKKEYIRAILDGTLNCFSAAHQRMETEIHGDTAKLIGQSLVSAAVFGDGRHSWRLQLTIQLVNRGGQWRIGETTASAYG